MRQHTHFWRSGRSGDPLSLVTKSGAFGTVGTYSYHVVKRMMYLDFGNTVIALYIEL